MEKFLEYEITGDDAIIIDFDNDQKHTAKYQIRVLPNDIQRGDKVVLSLNKHACKVFAKLFAQLAEDNYKDGYHLHIGLSENQKRNEGLRIVLDKNGRA